MRPGLHKPTSTEKSSSLPLCVRSVIGEETQRRPLPDIHRQRSKPAQEDAYSWPGPQFSSPLPPPPAPNSFPVPVYHLLSTHVTIPDNVSSAVLKRHHLSLQPYRKALISERNLGPGSTAAIWLSLD